MPLELDQRLKLNEATCKAANLTDRFSDDDLKKIGAEVFEGYDRDVGSRRRWHERMRASMELALQIKPGKTFPWPNAANVAFPLLTIAALQFHSRAYPALFKGPEIVKYKLPGPDADGEASKKAPLVARFMSYQVLEQDEAFEEQHDRLYIHVPIVGCAFTKSYYSSKEGHNVTDFVPADDLVIDYYAKSVEKALRKTQHVLLYRNDVWERCGAGVWRDIREEPWFSGDSRPQLPEKNAEKDRISGQYQPADGSGDAFFFLEQHTWMDLDGDGYAEPYAITIERNTKEVVRIVARWEDPADIEYAAEKVLRIRATEYFTKHELIPSPDGGIYGLGFGALVGPLNESVDTLVNQLLDKGTLMNTAGGFLARGVKIRGGAQQFDPFGWNHVDATGDDLRKGIFPLPISEPSAVLFNLLTLLINYTQRISGSTDVMVGENPGQNTPAYNMQSMVEQGMKIYSAIFKRLWRSMKQEFQKLFILNARHLDRIPFGTEVVTRELFLGDPSRLAPAADPNMVSEGMKTQQAVTIKQAALATPGYDMVEVEKRFLRTLQVEDVEVIYPGPGKVPDLPNPKAAAEQLKTQRTQMELEAQREQFIIEMMETRRLNNAQILKLEADAAKAMADAASADAPHQLALLEARLGAIKDHNEAINRRLEILMKGPGNGPAASDGSGGGMAQPSRDEIVSQVPPLASGVPQGDMGLGGNPG